MFEPLYRLQIGRLYSSINPKSIPYRLKFRPSIRETEMLTHLLRFCFYYFDLGGYLETLETRNTIGLVFVRLKFAVFFYFASIAAPPKVIVDILFGKTNFLGHPVGVANP